MQPFRPETSDGSPVGRVATLLSTQAGDPKLAAFGTGDVSGEPDVSQPLEFATPPRTAFPLVPKTTGSLFEGAPAYYEGDRVHLLAQYSPRDLHLLDADGRYLRADGAFEILSGPASDQIEGSLRAGTATFTGLWDADFDGLLVIEGPGGVAIEGPGVRVYDSVGPDWTLAFAQADDLLSIELRNAEGDLVLVEPPTRELNDLEGVLHSVDGDAPWEMGMCGWSLSLNPSGAAHDVEMCLDRAGAPLCAAGQVRGELVVWPDDDC